jgi:hypothetical protein
LSHVCLYFIRLADFSHYFDIFKFSLKKNKVAVTVVNLKPLENSNKDKKAAEAEPGCVVSKVASENTASVPNSSVSDAEAVHQIVLCLAKKNPQQATLDELHTALALKCPGFSITSIIKAVMGHSNLFTVINNETVVLGELNQEFVECYFELAGMYQFKTSATALLSSMGQCTVKVSNYFLVTDMPCLFLRVDEGMTSILFQLSTSKAFLMKVTGSQDWQQGQILTSVLRFRKNCKKKLGFS